MPPPLTLQETTVVDLLRRRRVASLAQLRQRAHLSHMTVFRALAKVGYYTSLNENSAWYTLRQTPHFDDRGLWVYRQLCFSRHGTLTQTLRVLVETSPAGSTVSELQDQVHTHVANLLSRLCQAGQLTAQRLHRQAVYLALDPVQQARQWTQRQALIQPLPASAPLALPAEWPALPLLRLLVAMIQRPQASAAQLVHALQEEGWAYRPDQVRQVIAFYDLKKKRHTGHG